MELDKYNKIREEILEIIRNENLSTEDTYKIQALTRQLTQPSFEHHSPPTSIIEQGSNVETASYIIFGVDTDNDGITDEIYAKSGSTGEIAFSGTNASAIIQAAINALTPGRTWKEKVVIKGNLTINNTINLDSYLVLDLSEAILTLADHSNSHMLKADSKEYIDIIGGILDGNRAKQTSGNGIYIYNSTRIRISGTTLKNIKKTGIGLTSTTYFTIDSVTVDTAGDPQSGSGIACTDGCWDGAIIGSKTYNTGATGISISGANANSGRISIANCQVDTAGYNGIFLYFNVYDSSVVGCTVRHVTFGWGIELENAMRNTISNNVILDSGPSIGIKVYGPSAFQNTIIGNIVKGVGRHGIAISGGADLNTVIGNIIIANAVTDAKYDGISIGGKDTGGGSGSGGNVGNIIEGNIIQTTSCYHRLYSAIREYGSSSEYNIIKNNMIKGSDYIHKILWVGSKTKVSGNFGFVTENSGTATNLANGGLIAHGLAGTPTVVTLTCLNSTYDGEPVLVYWDKSNTNNTHIAVDIYWANGTAINDSVIYVSWSAQYKP